MMIDRRNFLVAAGSAAAALTFPHQAAAGAPSLSPVAMRADLDLMSRAYRSMHPGLDRYLGTARFIARIDALKDWAGRERGLAAFYIELARLTAAVRCGHTYPNPLNQKKAVRQALFSGRDRVPFAFRWIDGRMIFTRALAGEIALPAGSEILALDGVPTRRLLQLMFPLARADGGNDAKRVAQMEVDGRERSAAFDIYRPLVAPVRTDGLVEVRARTPSGAERALLLPCVTEAEREAAAKGAREDGGWRFDLADGIGTLTMPNWALYNSKWDWRAFLDNVADRLIDEDARGLVIDIRDNEGGIECGDHLLERLVRRDLIRPGYVRRTRYRQAPADLLPVLDTWDPSFQNWGEAASGPDGAGFYALSRDDDGPIRPRGRRFAGKVVVLVGPTNSSATFQFAEMVKGSGVATLVGEPTGGNRRGINGGAYFFVRLPETGLEVDLPLIGYFPDGPRPDAGIVPDLIVAASRADIVNGADRQMAAALKLIRDT